MRESYLYSDLKMYRVSALSRVTGAITGGILGALTDFVVENPLNLIGNLIKEGIFKADTKTQLAGNIFKFLYYSIGYILLWPFTPIKGLIDGAGYGIEYGFKKSWLTPALLEHDQTRSAFFKHFGRSEPTNILAPQHIDLKHNSANLDFKRKKLKSTEYKIKSAIYIGIAALAITAAFLVIFPPAGVIAATVGPIINAMTQTLSGIAPILIPAVPYLLAIATAGAVAIIGKLASSIGVGIGKAINKYGKENLSSDDIDNYYNYDEDYEYKNNLMSHSFKGKKATTANIAPSVRQQKQTQINNQNVNNPAFNDKSTNQRTAYVTVFKDNFPVKRTPFVTESGKEVTAVMPNRSVDAGSDEPSLVQKVHV